MVYEMISDISNVIVFGVSITAMLFTVYHWRVFRWTIVIPVSMAIASGMYQWLGTTTLTNVLYDLSYMVVLYLLLSTRVCRNKENACGTCTHNARCK